MNLPGNAPVRTSRGAYLPYLPACKSTQTRHFSIFIFLAGLRTERRRPGASARYQRWHWVVAASSEAVLRVAADILALHAQAGQPPSPLKTPTSISAARAPHTRLHARGGLGGGSRNPRSAGAAVVGVCSGLCTPPPHPNHPPPPPWDIEGWWCVRTA